ncbi:29 kDa ribonucleoprotein A, chloroplastic-like [Canna indica]|uniref:29 kDa ribonucleoprotein A, chloroplastic-like n=1 Tax=Canna indica TaxID=4628 RepID=A0AAQ3Q297_9LILI|nr:29 kDa ribonucleoprotein A, chloroplastic-like [Canna indica]
MAASSFLIPSLSPQIPTISSSKAQTLTFALSSPILSSSKPFSPVKNVSYPAYTSFPFMRKAPAVVPGIITKVALSSDLEFSGGEQYSQDLKLFVGNLPFSVDSAQLAGLFQRAGNVEMVEVIYDKLSGKSRGFGFVTMSTIEEVEAATQHFNGYTLEGRALRVNSGPPPRRDEFSSRPFRTSANLDSSNRVHVGNLSWDVDDSSLHTLFSDQGKVLEAKVIYDRESGRSRGFGFVTYSSAEEADNAVASLNGADLDGRSIRVTVAERRPRRQF